MDKLLFRTIVLCLCLGLWGCGPTPSSLGVGEPSFTTPQAFNEWMQNYYKHPQPYLFYASFDFINRDQPQASRLVPMAAFYCELFKKHPERMTEWAGRVLSWNLTEENEAIVWCAMKCANPVEAGRMLRVYEGQATGDRKEAMQRLMVLNVSGKHPGDPAVPYFGDEIVLPQDLDRLWMKWYVTGDPRNVLVVSLFLSQLPEIEPQERPLPPAVMMGAAARWSLLANARQNPDVLRIVKKRFAQLEEGRVKFHLGFIVRETERKIMEEGARTNFPAIVR